MWKSCKNVWFIEKSYEKILHTELLIYYIMDTLIFCVELISSWEMTGKEKWFLKNDSVEVVYLNGTPEISTTQIKKYLWRIHNYTIKKQNKLNIYFQGGKTMANKYAGTKTEKNLWEAYAGESKARNRYTYYASVSNMQLIFN